MYLPGNHGAGNEANKQTTPQDRLVIAPAVSVKFE
jgi:hypothetical protein